jgi:hypothetical protein
MYLQLAENRTPSSQSDNPFIFIPDTSGQSKGLWVREDYFDSLPDDEFNRMMRKLAPFQPGTNGAMSEGRFLASRASRRQKRAEKKEKKAQIKKENKDRRASTIANLVNTFGGVASSIFGKKASPETEPETTPETEAPTSTPLYKNPFVILAGLGLVGGGIYLATRNR